LLDRDDVSSGLAFALEAWGTLALCFLRFGLTHERNAPVSAGGPGLLVPLLVGCAFTVLVCLLGPLTQCGLNPARDLGPRLVAALAGGWGYAALPGPRGGFWV
jgi:glycerol uptake facilitator protein